MVALGPSAQLAFDRPATPRSWSLTRDLLIGRGFLAARQFEPPSVLERPSAVGSFEALVAHEVSMLARSPLVAEELDVLGQPTLESMARELRQPPSALMEKRAVVRIQRESSRPERDVQPFVMAVRRLIESEQLTAARQLLNAAPGYILSDPLVVKLRSILAPPVVKRVDKRDVDRSQEYEWLKTEGQKYRGRWVALEGNSLLASAPTLRDLRETLKTIALANPPLLHRVD